MKKIKQLKQWGIFQNNSKEIKEHGFSFTVLHPDNMEYSYLCCPRDSDIECNSLKEAISWINNY